MHYGDFAEYTLDSIEQSAAVTFALRGWLGAQCFDVPHVLSVCAEEFLFEGTHLDEELRQTLDLYKVRKQPQPADAMDEDEDHESEDETPQINMDELLDDFDELNMDDD